MNEIVRLDISNLMGKKVYVKTGDAFSSMPLHCHEYYELIYYSDANATCTINGNSILLDSGSLCLLTPLDFHKTVNNRKNNKLFFVNISFARDFLDNNITADLSSAIYIKNIRYTDPIYQIISIIKTNYNTSDISQIKHLLSALIDFIKKHSQSSKIEKNTTTDFHRKALEYLSLNFTENIKLADIANRLHLSPTYFSALFSKTFGCTFIDYLTSLRLNYSKQLLISTDYSVTQICYDCGFTSLSHFLRVFKIRYNITPTR